MNTSLLLNEDSCYQALVSRDARFDGVYYVGGRTTGVYCRFVCPAKNPRRENCTCFPTAAPAERAASGASTPSSRSVTASIPPASAKRERPGSPSNRWYVTWPTALPWIGPRC